MSLYSSAILSCDNIPDAVWKIELVTLLRAFVNNLLLCTEKDKAVVEYSIGGLENNIFASKYIPYLPDREWLIMEVERVLHEPNKK